MIITLVEESKEDTRRDNVEGESKDFREIMIFLYFKNELIIIQIN